MNLSKKGDLTMLNTTQSPTTFFQAVCNQIFSAEHQYEIDKLFDKLKYGENAEILFSRHPELINIFRTLHETQDKPAYEKILIALRKAWSEDIYNEVINISIFRHKIHKGDYKISTAQMEKIVAHAYTQKSHVTTGKITAEKYNSELDDYDRVYEKNRIAGKIIANLLNI